MKTLNYLYDIAFSFSQKDENLATELYNLLKDRLSCFIYSEQQKRLGGNDGERVFNSVFSKESRIVVILFNCDWGNTKWTKIEETAIRNKGFDEGYDFVILIPTENNIDPPQWLPKNRIWIGLERWGIESAASVIEARVQEFGGVIKVETISDKAAKVEQELLDKRKRDQTLESPDGLSLALLELKSIEAEIIKHESEIREKTSNWHINVRPNNKNGYDILSYGYYLTFQFNQRYSNSLSGAYLSIAFFKGYFNEYGNASGAENKRLGFTRVRFDINEFNQYGWSIIDSRKDFKSTNLLVEEWVDKLISFASKERAKNHY